MKLVTVSQMQAIEKEADSSGFTYDQMMENAGQGLADLIYDLFEDDLETEIVGLVGPGKNGGDTLIALAELAAEGWKAQAYLVKRKKDDLIRRFTEAEGEWIRMYPHFKNSYLVPVSSQSGAHGGADEILNRSFYSSAASPMDEWDRFAGHEQGAASILVGIAGVESMKRNLPVNITDLVSLRPDATRLSQLL